MDATKITQLAQLLRDSGDKVLNERYKLTLSAQLLQTLGAAFRLIVDEADDLADASASLLHSKHVTAAAGVQPDAGHFRVLGRCHNARTAEMCDLQLIYDFVQKTRILCVTHFAAAGAAGADQQQQTVDITKFRNLRRLEIAKLPVGRVRGIQKLRAHLQELKCLQAIDSVEEIISHCGGDGATGFAWNELHTVDFSYNRLRKVDGSLEFVTALQYLNLSHNHIDSVDAIKWLKNLKHLNLSYNRLAFVPTLHVEAPRRLQVLVLASNLIEDMQGLSRLDALTELDMSDNYLLDHRALMPLSTLVALQLLNLTGNPLACLPKHRQTTARFLHRNTTHGHFSLDGEPLSKPEKSLTGQQRSSLMRSGRGQPFFSFRSSSSAAARSSPTASTLTLPSAAGSRLPTADNTPASSVNGSLRSLRMDESMMSNASVNLDTWTVHRRLRPKAATIAEHPPGTEPETVVATSAATKAKSPRLADLVNTEHLETRKHIEEMRKLHGDSWLLVQQQHKNGGGGSGPVAVADADGGQQSPLPPMEGIDQLMTSTPNCNESSSRQLSDAESGNLSADASEYTTALELQNTSDDLGVQPLAEAVPPAASEQNLTAQLLADIFPSNGNGNGSAALAAAAEDDKTLDFEDDADDPPSEPEDNEVMYIVNHMPSLADMFLVVSAVGLREKDALTGRTQTRWPMSVLESCERTRSDVLRLQFDTLNRDRKERVYRVETGLCQQLERYLRGILAARPLSEMNQRMWRCVKCGVQFSREAQKLQGSGRRERAAEQPRCPNCGSGFLVEMHESPTTVKEAVKTTVEATPPVPPVTPVAVEVKPVATGVLRSSDSQSSIAPHNRQGATTATITTTTNNGAWTATTDITTASMATTSTTTEPPFNPNPMPSRSAQSLNGSSSCSRLSAASSYDSNRSDAAIAAAAALATTTGDATTRRTPQHRRRHEFNDTGSLESEVGRLSNPSLSSIEVLSSEFSSSSAASRKPSGGGVGTDEDVARMIGGLAPDAEDQRTIGLRLDAVADQINRLGINESAKKSASLQVETSNRQTSTRDLQHLVENSNDPAPAVIRNPVAHGAILLTESSSSGSVTDSICTTYDQHQRTITNSSMASSIIAVDNEGAQQQQRSPDKKASAATDSSMLGAMLGGLFQSTNSLLAVGKQRIAGSNNGNNGSQTGSPATRTPTKSSPSPPAGARSPAAAAACKPFRWSFTDFEQCDHRLKMHLFETVFEDDNEQLKWLVRGQLVVERQAGGGGGGGVRWRGGEAVWVMSTTKFYGLQIVGEESDDVSQWLRRQLSGTIDRLRSVRILPWKCGLTIDIKGLGEVQLLLQDILRTDSLLLFLANNPLPDTCTLHYQPAEWLLHQLLLTTEAAPLKMMSILSECYVNEGADDNAATQVERLLGLIVTETHLHLLAPAPEWLSESAAASAGEAEDALEAVVAAEAVMEAEAHQQLASVLPLRQRQLMANLVAVERLGVACVRFVYLDEVQDQQTEWTCTFATPAAAATTLDAVAQSWERLFGVPLEQT